MNDRYFFQSSCSSFIDTDLSSIMNKIVVRQAEKRAAWIDSEIKKLIPMWLISRLPIKNKFIASFIKFFMNIEVVSETHSPNGTWIRIYKNGKERAEEFFKL